MCGFVLGEEFAFEVSVVDRGLGTWVWRVRIEFEDDLRGRRGGRTLPRRIYTVWIC